MAVADVDHHKIRRSGDKRNFHFGKLLVQISSALIDYALRTIGLPHVVAVAYLDNRASRHVLEKLGFTSAGPCEYRGAHVERYVLGADAWRGSS